MKQRLNETDDEFEKRKKRVRRQRSTQDGLASALAHGGGSGGGISVPTNIVVNGDFEDGTTGWTGISVTAGVASTDGGNLGYQDFATEIGTGYNYSIEVDIQGANPQFGVRADSSAGADLFVVTPLGTGMLLYGGSFTATSTTSSFYVDNGSNTALFDNVSITKIP